MRVGIDARKIADYGIGTYVRGLVEALIAQNAADEYVLFAPKGVALPHGVEHVVVDAPHYSIQELIAVGRAADEQRLDLFHAPHYVIPRTRVPVVATIHDLIQIHQPMRNPLAPLYARWMLRRAVRKAIRVLTVSESIRGEVIRELDGNAAKIIVTPNGVDPAFTPGDGAREAATFLFVGNDKRHKNVDRLVAAMDHVRSDPQGGGGLPGTDGRDAKLVIVGAPFERFRGRAGIELRGFVSNDQLLALYRNATALVMPSIEEGFGLPAAEAMACGTPVITSTAPALVEVTRDAALHVDALDVDAIASAMLRVMRDAELRASLARRGIDRARSFSWNLTAQITRSAYESAIR